MKFKLNPTQQLAALLSLMVILVSAFNWSERIALHAATTIGFALVLYWMFEQFSSKKKNIWNTVITALIIFLVLHFPITNVEVVHGMVAVFVAMVMKFFIEYKGSPVINPAVAGLLVTALLGRLIPGLEDPFVSWWGASFQGALSLILVLLWAAFGLRMWRKFPVVLSFLVVHGLLMLFQGQEWNFIEYTFTDSTIYFLAAVMLVEPHTSPLRRKDQMLYGLIAAILYNVFLGYSVPYFELFAIAGANISNMLLRPKRKAAKKATGSQEE